jgi:putative transposase
MPVVQEARERLSLSTICKALRLNRASFYSKPSSSGVPSKPRQTPRKLTSEDRARFLAIAHSEEFKDQPPREIYATLLSRGEHVCYWRTMYRILAQEGESRERRSLRSHPTYSKPSLTATRPNQIWSWDITRLPSTRRGEFFYLYTVLDLYSRYVVAWSVEIEESAELSNQLIRKAVKAHKIKEGQLTLHNDRGAPMTSGTFQTLCALLGVAQSLSRPRVSDDNPYSESQFKTMKYQPEYPEQFETLRAARHWVKGFTEWYNEAHHHTGIALYTPEEVFTGRYEEVAKVREAVMAKAYAEHPERFVKGKPKVARPALEVSINPAPPPCFL